MRPLSIFGLLLVHVTTLLVSAVLMLIGHKLSGYVIWSVFPESYRVRQISLYLLDSLPFYAFVLMVLTIGIPLLREKFNSSFIWRICTGTAAVLIAVVMHQPLFPTSNLGVAVLLVIALYGSVLFPSVRATWKFLFRLEEAWKLVSNVRGGWYGLVGGVFLLVTYSAGLQVAVKSGIVDPETALYRSQDEPSPKSTWYNSRLDSVNESGFDAPHPALFVREELNLKLPPLAQFVDVDGDGFTDVVARRANDGLAIWRNENGQLANAEPLVPQLAESVIGSFAFADFNGDGKLDLLAGQKELPLESTIYNAFVKKIFWHFARNPVSRGRIFAQHNILEWQEVTDEVFPKGAPWAFRKVEPIIWLDANSDGLLDFIWQQYPHPQESLNGLFIQRQTGLFENSIEQLIIGSPGRVYPEGGDFGDVDGDGDIDLFAFGYLYLRNGSKFVKACGKDFHHFVCDMEGRNDEGALFEDIDGDGNMDVLVSHHGANPKLPKYYLQVFLGGDKEAELDWIEGLSSSFYGFNTYLRSQDFDSNGRQDILMIRAGRLLSFHGNKLIDLLPAITGLPSGQVRPLGWVDIDEDGDWDFLANHEGDNKTYLYRNQLSPRRYMKISAVGPGGAENQYGSTIQISLPNGRSAIRSYRPAAGYRGITDPRLVYEIVPDHRYDIRACFASLLDSPNGTFEGSGIRILVVKREANCIHYALTIDVGVQRLDLKLIAGAELASVSIR